MKEQSNEFLYIFRGGADPKQMSPEQMQRNTDAWFGWINDLKVKAILKADAPSRMEEKCWRVTKAKPSPTVPSSKEKRKLAATFFFRRETSKLRSN